MSNGLEDALSKNALLDCGIKFCHLPENSLETLLNIFNYIWTTGKFPEDWTLATIIPIPKPGKDPAEPNNYSFNKLSM